MQQKEIMQKTIEILVKQVIRENLNENKIIIKEIVKKNLIPEIKSYIQETVLLELNNAINKDDIKENDVQPKSNPKVYNLKEESCQPQKNSSENNNYKNGK